MDQQVYVWDIAIGSLKMTLKIPEVNSAVSDVAFSPDGAVLAVAHVQQIWLWDTATGKNLAVLDSPATVFAMAYSPDGRFIATGTSDGNIHLWGVPASG